MCLLTRNSIASTYHLSDHQTDNYKRCYTIPSKFTVSFSLWTVYGEAKDSNLESMFKEVSHDVIAHLTWSIWGSFTLLAALLLLVMCARRDSFSYVNKLWIYLCLFTCPLYYKFCQQFYTFVSWSSCVSLVAVVHDFWCLLLPYVQRYWLGYSGPIKLFNLCICDSFN